jgi:hypothetical protein
MASLFRPPLRLILLFVALLAVTCAGGPGAAQASPAADQPAPSPDPRALGDPNAPITLIEYSDYQ